MTMLHAVAWFFAGWFLTNAVPHGVAALQGRAFPTPFARPPGIGLSTSRQNVLWSGLNLVIGWALLCEVGAFSPRDPIHAAVFFAGVASFAWFLAGRLGRQYGGNAPADQRQAS